ncbi:hypothetical protein Tco_1340512, partial [Tanacetum coccineum]
SEPLSPDRVFDFPIDEPEPHPAYDFFAPGPLPGYAGNPNNNNRWIEADVPLLGELGEIGEPQGAEVDEPMAVPAIEEVFEPMVEAEEQMAAPIIDMEEDLVALFGEDDDSEPPCVYEVRGPSTSATEGPSFPLLAPGLPVPPSVIEDLSTRLGNLEYRHGQLVKKVIHVMVSQMVQAADRWEQVGAQVEQGQQTAAQKDEGIAELTQQVQALQEAMQQRDSQIQQLHTTVTEMSSRESTLM